MRYIICVLTLFLIIFGCKTKSTSTIGQSLIIQMSIDSALKLDSGLNSKEYWIDFSKVQYFDKSSINDFLRYRANFIEINGDSLIRNDSTWKQYGFLQKMLIRFRSIESKGDSIIINLDKIKASDGSNGIEVIIKKIDNDFKVVSSKITWIS